MVTSHHNPSIDSDSILSITSERADKQVEYTHAQEQLSHAVEILQQKMKPNYKWVYGVIVTLIIIGVILIPILFVVRKRRAAKQSQLKQIETRIHEGEQTLAKAQIQNEVLINSNKELFEQRMRQFQQNSMALRSSHNIQHELYWKDYHEMCSVINQHLFLLANKLEQLGVLSEKEIRFCILVTLQLSQKEMAELLHYSINGIGKYKYNVSQKLGTTAKNLYDFLAKMAVAV